MLVTVCGHACSVLQVVFLCSVLPDPLVGNTMLLPFYSFYRQILADVLLRDRLDLDSTGTAHGLSENHNNQCISNALNPSVIYMWEAQSATHETLQQYTA